MLLLVLPAVRRSHGHLDGLLKTIEARYNRTQSLKLDFSETYAGIGRPAQTESGVLYLRKPGRMRWEYTSPAGQAFPLRRQRGILNTLPTIHSAEKSKLKESEDMRAPLAFLLGKLDFDKEFKSFQTTAGRRRHLDRRRAEIGKPGLHKGGISGRADGEIHRVRVTGQDQSKLDFTFSHEQLNAPVSPRDVRVSCRRRACRSSRKAQ